VRQPSLTRPTRVVATGYFTIVGDGTALTGTVNFLSDAANPPITSQGLQTAEATLAAGTLKIPWCLTYDVPAGHRYELLKAVEAGVTCTLSKITETAG
jgi:hypothetical protein